MILDDTWDEKVAKLEAEVVRLRAVCDEQNQMIYIRDFEIVKLRAALKPFARNVNALSLGEALGHIEREHLLAARNALAEEGK